MRIEPCNIAAGRFFDGEVERKWNMLLWVVEQLYFARILGDVFLDDRPCAVGRKAIDEEQLFLGRHRMQEKLNQRLYMFYFVIERADYRY